MHFVLRSEAYSLRQGTFDPEISEVANAFIKQVCHKENGLVPALQKKSHVTCDYRTGEERDTKKRKEKSHTDLSADPRPQHSADLHRKITAGCKQKAKNTQ